MDNIKIKPIKDSNNTGLPTAQLIVDGYEIPISVVRIFSDQECEIDMKRVR